MKKLHILLLIIPFLIIINKQSFSQDYFRYYYYVNVSEAELDSAISRFLQYHPEHRVPDKWILEGLKNDSSSAGLKILLKTHVYKISPVRNYYMACPLDSSCIYIIGFGNTNGKVNLSLCDIKMDKNLNNPLFTRQKLGAIFQERKALIATFEKEILVVIEKYMPDAVFVRKSFF